MSKEKPFPSVLVVCQESECHIQLHTGALIAVFPGGGDDVKHNAILAAKALARGVSVSASPPQPRKTPR